MYICINQLKLIDTRYKFAIYRKEHFNAAHRLHNPNLSDEENRNLFDKCNNSNYHGHNYTLIVKVIGQIDPLTGYVIDTKVLSDIVNTYVIDKMDHKNLNLDVEAFSQLNPTVENIALVIYEIIRAKIESKYELKIILYETERNYVEYPA